MSSELNFNTAIELSDARLHTSMFVIDVGTMGPDLATGRTSSLLDMKLVNNGSLVELKLKNKRTGKTITKLVSATNFVDLTVKEQSTLTVVAAPQPKLVQPEAVTPFTAPSETNS